MTKREPCITQYRKSGNIFKDLDRPVVSDLRTVKVPLLGDIYDILGSLKPVFLSLIRDIHFISACTHRYKFEKRLFISWRNEAYVQMDIR